MGFALLITTAGASQAQSAPPAGILPRPQDLAPSLPTGRPADLPDRPISRELGKPQDELRVDVQRFVVDDQAPAALREALPALTVGFVGPQRSYEDLVEAAAAVTRFLQSELGYYLGYAYLPEQAAEDGVIRIAVLEGRLDEVQLNWSDGLPVDRGVVERYLARLVPGSILTVRDVERTVFLINDLRGITARFEVKAGRKPGTATLVVTPQPESRWSQRYELDNHGSRFSGEWRLSALAQWNSPTGAGDGLVFNLLSSETGGLRFALASYTRPVGDDGLKLGLSLSYVDYQIDKDKLPINLNGDISTLTAFGLYPLVRSRNLNVFGLASLDLKRFEDRQGLTGFSRDKSVDALRLGLFGDWRDAWLSGGVSTYELGLALGQIDLSPPQVFDDVDDRFVVLSGQIARLQNIVDARLLLYLSLRGQWTPDNLDSAEQFQLGGPDRVRAFAPGEGTGDRGVVATAELRWLPPDAWLGRLARELVFSTFLDIGHVRYRSKLSAPSVSTDNAATLAGAGFGLVWDRPGDFTIRASLAWPLVGEGRSDPVDRSPRAHLLLSKSF
ncbi:ShlB/FhaC/HecB family hemolysin secretion/activation protein [Aquariibacter albus]|uniref:ShlB/FhaC/HecB family hemolysin secretion/activation protein n=1 Tax=Aquariibacter albus TaxID=2759899 RepID=A0A839HUB1_9BURK|nr:ShlB/FhaC/HecB family hemolysin secretion/activation protein [Aquariibacter albus]MBB1163149.1 ShlB/FhaC/HecB family hemolysin secretion/activation protein [Aquariibacter albus]